MFRDSLSGVARVFYPSGRLWQYVPYANVYRSIRYGTATTWYEDGQMNTKEDYVGGVRHGDLLTYYPDGRLKRRDHYTNGTCGIGRCYGPDGVPVPYFSYEQLPLYPGGEEMLLKELNKAVRLNALEIEAMRQDSYRSQRWQMSPRRQVELELTVSPEGRITGARVVKSTARYLNTAALRAVARLKRPFVPGRRDGQVMLSYLTVPIYYTLEHAPVPVQQPNYPGRRYR